MEVTTTRTVSTMEFSMEGGKGGMTMTRSSGGGGGGGEVTMTRSSTSSGGGGRGGVEVEVSRTSRSVTGGGGGSVDISKVSFPRPPCRPVLGHHNVAIVRLSDRLTDRGAASVCHTSQSRP